MIEENKNIISQKGKFTHLADYAERGNGTNYFGKIVAQIWHLYEERKENSLDFDDLL